MIRGTTTTFKFTLPYHKDEFTWVRIKFWQPNNPSDLLPIIKIKDDCGTTDNPKELVVSLTAEETSRFLDKYKAKMQLRASHALTGRVLGTTEQTVTVYPMPDDMIAEDPSIPPADENGLVVFDGGSIVD